MAALEFSTSSPFIAVGDRLIIIYISKNILKSEHRNFEQEKLKPIDFLLSSRFGGYYNFETSKNINISQCLQARPHATCPSKNLGS